MRIIAALSLLAVSLGAVSLHAVEPLKTDANWSKPVGDIRGRLVAETREVKGRQVVKLWLELENTGSLQKGVVTHSPFAFDLTVRDADGNEVASDAQRADILSSPRTAELPRECTLRFPVTLSQEEAWNLDIATHLWKLKPGSYTLSGKYHIPAPRPRKTPAGDVVHPWSGELELPEVRVELK